MNDYTDYAFPVSHQNCPSCGNLSTSDEQAGLIKRELFAAHALQGILASYTPAGAVDFDAIAFDAVTAADALIGALEE